MDILNANKLNRTEFNPLYTVIFLFWTAIVSPLLVLCLFFALKFAINTNLRINFYKNHHYLRKIFGLVK